MKSRRIRFCVFSCTTMLAACLSVFVFFGHRVLQEVSPLFVPPESCRHSWKRSLDAVRQCLRAKWEMQNTSTVFQDIDYCVGWRLRNRVGKFSTGNPAIISPTHFIPPKKHDQQGVFLTLGVADINTELFVQRRYSGWLFYGVDRNSEKRELYETVGVFYNIQLSAPLLSRLVPSTYINRSKIISLIELVSGVLKRFAIDYMMINNQSIAISVLPQLARSGPVERSGIAVCQVTVNISKDELDGENRGKRSIGDMVKLLVLGSWVPLQAEWSHDGAAKLYLVNAVSLYCLDKFFSECK